VLRSIWVLFLYVSFLGLSTAAPFIATLGYVWVDTFTPQNVAYIVLNQMPVAMIMGVVALGGYLLFDRRSPPPLSAETILMVAMTIWVNATMIWAVAPSSAWEKWDWAFKTLAFASFIPLVIRSRVQIEAFAQTYVLSLAANFVPFGLKVMISGGGYGQNLGLSGNGANTGLGEGGLLSMACLMAVPLALHLSQHSQLIPRMKLLPLPYWIVAGLAVVTAIGTYERSAIVGIVVLAAYMWVRSRHKFAFGIVAAVVAVLIVYTTSSAWNARVSTIGDYAQENSALTRILVWRWTLEFSATHPMGGGFQSYVVNHIEFPPAGGLPAVIEFGRAFHSIYFEMLGEQGYPGVVMLFLLVGITLYKLRRIAKEARAHADLEWVASLSDALQSGIVVFLACGAFVGVMFQPMFWYFIAMSISLNAYMWRARRQDAKPPAGWRGMVAQAAGFPSRRPELPGWRRPAGPGVTAAATAPR
jgi:putative inorganic carbon (HCO3(-)) transporter